MPAAERNRQGRLP
ncbi:hypothetical protein YPPY92_1835, partial [Yersinia pestis PY-92]